MDLSPENAFPELGTNDADELVESSGLSPDTAFPELSYTETDDDLFHQSIRATDGVNPDQAAKQREVGERLGVDPGLVNRNWGELLKQDEADYLKKTVANTSYLKKFLAEPENMAVARDDVENLAGLEDTLSAFDPLVGVAKSVGRSFLKLSPMAAQFGLNTVGGVAGFLDEGAKAIDEVTPDWLVGRSGGYFGALRDQALDWSNWIQHNIMESEALSLPEEKRKPLIDNPELLLDPEWLTQNVGDAAGSLAIMLGAAVASGGSSEAAAFTGGSMEGGDLYRELIEDGVDSRKALYASMAFGYAVTRLEKVGLGAILGKVRVRSIGKRLAKSFVAGGVEGFTEWAEEPIQAFIASLAKDGVLTTAFDEALTATRNIDVIPGAVIAGGGVAYGGKYRVEYERGKRAEENKQFFQAINDKVAASTLRERSQGVFKVYAQSLQEMENTPDDVFIPVEPFRSAVGNDAAFLKLLQDTGTLDQYQAAQATGGDIAIPMSEFLTHIAGTEAAIALENDFRFAPDQMTPREAEAWANNYSEVWADDLARAQEAAERTMAENDDAEQIRHVLANGLAQIGVDFDSADASAQVWASRALIASQGYTQAGQPMTPLEWVMSKNMTVRNGETGVEFPLNSMLGDIQRPAGTTLQQDEGSVQYQQLNENVDLDSEVEVVRGTPQFEGKALHTLTKGEGRKQIKEAVAGTYQNEETGWDIQVAKNDAGKMVNSAQSDTGIGGVPHVEAIMALPELIRVARLAETHPDTKGARFLKQVHRMFAPMQLGDNVYSVKLTVKEFEGKYLATIDEVHKAYDLRLEKEMSGQEPRPDNQGATEGIRYKDAPEGGVYSSATAAPLKTNLRSLLEGVKSSYDGQAYAQESKGVVDFSQNETLLTVFKGRDRSTVMHESGHIFREDLKHLAQLPNAPEQVKRDWQAVQDHSLEQAETVLQDAIKFGENMIRRIGAATSKGTATIEQLEEVKNALKQLRDGGVELVKNHIMSAGGETVLSDMVEAGQHEVFARSFEGYLREGKAPNIALGKVFKDFKRWLTHIYRSLRKLNVTMNDEIRGVFDRMLATEDMMSELADANNFAPLYETAEEANMTDEEFTLYQQAHNEARERAKEKLLAKLMKDIERRNKKWYNEERKRVSDEVKENLLNSKAYRAWHYLSKGYFPDEAGSNAKGAVVEKPVRLDTETILKEWGEAALSEIIRTVPPVHAKGGVHPDIMATQLGFTSGDELIEVLRGLQPLGKAVEYEVNAHMQEYNKLMEDMDIRSEAEAMLQNESRVDFLALEEDIARGVINREKNKKNFTARVREAAQRAKGIREIARRTLGGMRVPAAIQVHTHKQAERIASREAVEAAWKGDEAAMARAKNRQLYAAAFISEATKAREEVERIRKYLAKFNSKGVRKNLDRDYLDQIDTILERFDMRKSTTYKDIAGRKSLAQWIAEQEAKGFEPNISDKLRMETFRISYKTMTLDELRELNAGVKSIETIGRLKFKLLTARDKRDFDQTVQHLTTQTADAYKENLGPDFLPREAAKKKPIMKAIDAHLTKIEFICLVLDGGKMNGAWWERIYRPINDGVNKKTARFLEIRDQIYGDTMFGRYSKREMVRMRSKKVFVSEVNESFTKEQLLTIALNRGNVYNWEALLAGEKWTAEAGEAVLAKLDERDWDVVENIWKYVDSFWPEVEGLYKRLSGTPPKKVDPDPFVTPLGRTMRGGYYPMIADADLNIKASQREDAKNVQEMFGGNAFRPSTRNGHAKERTDFGGQRVAFSLDGLVRHLDQITHDIYLREAVIDVDRLLQNERIQNIIIRALGKEQYDQMRPWLASVAGQRPYSYDGIQRVAKFLRKNATVAIMGWKSTVFLSQYAGLLNVVPYLENKGLAGKTGKGKASARLLLNLMRSMGESRVVLSPKGKKTKLIEEKSLEMRDRRHNFVQEVTDISHHFGFGRYISKWQEALMYFTALADYHVSSAAWLTAYDLALEEGKTERAAIDLADSIVRLSQGSGKEKDLSAAQRGDEWKRMWIMFFSYMNLNYNQIVSSGKGLKTGKRRGKFLGEMAFFWFFPVVAAELMAGRGPDDDEDESVPAWAAKKIVEHPAGMFPGIRDIVAAAQDDYGRPASLFGRVGNSMKRAYQEAIDEDGDNIEMFWKLAETGGYFVPFPSGQARITIKQTIEYMNGERDDFSPLFYSKK